LAVYHRWDTAPAKSQKLLHEITSPFFDQCRAAALPTNVTGEYGYLRGEFKTSATPVF
jgi:hypothetical protein